LNEKVEKKGSTLNIDVVQSLKELVERTRSILEVLDGGKD